ncbi:hypothetical protein GCM10017044_18710 [Kordiimonas sediminis]|uniref:Uncharacterized protein n=1 Tax=Kordiimonas sediminis TaxID=1735581 RepID=A0A919AT57_9PROT|nr:hypothetical protein [Kordiimonas sediminis]GHF24342.1 hypothetical protein GCM10017044_18710 [Kordiimonas sediminis]
MRLPSQNIKKINLPEFQEQFLTRTAIGVFIVALSYGLGIGQHFADAATTAYLSTAKTVLSVLVLLLLLPSFLRLLWLRYNHRAEFNSTESYIAAVAKNAGMMTFSLTFVFLIALEAASQSYLPQLQLDMPPSLYLKAVLCFSLLVFSLTFFIEARKANSEDD